MSLPRFSVNNPVLVNMLMFVVVAAGGLLALTTVREMFPESRPEKLYIVTVHPGVAPAEIEKAITVKIEEAVRDVVGVEKVDSTVSDGKSVTILTLLPEARNVDRVLQDVKAEIDTIEDLPLEAEKTVVRKIEPRLPVISVALYGPGDPAARKRAARALRDELLLLPGVSEVNLSGVKDDEISVEIRPEKLLEYDITFSEVAQAIRETNLDLSGGLLEGERALLSLRTLGEKLRGDDLRNLVIRSTSDGRTIYLSDVAVVRDTFVESDLESYFNSEPAIYCVVYKTLKQDAIRISQLVKAYVKGKQQADFDPHGIEAARAQPWYSRPLALAWAHTARLANLLLGQPDPEAVYRNSKARPFDHDFKTALHTDLARFVEGRIDLMVGNGIQGLFLMLLTMVLFLNWRVAFWGALGIPVTFLGTFILMHWFGVTLNLVSLLALIIVMSIDVDEAIVMSENIHRYLEMGMSPKAAAITGAEEVMWPIIVMTGTTIGAFFPLMFLQGQLGEFLKQLPLVCVAAMSISLLEAVVILPSHLGEVPPYVPPSDIAGNARSNWWQRTKARLSLKVTAVSNYIVDVWYDRFVRLSLRWRYVTLAVAIASLLCVLGMKNGDVVRTVYVQKMDSETLIAMLEMPIGTPASQTRDRLQQLSDYAVSLPEVVNVQMFVGRQVAVGGSGASSAKDGPHLGQMVLELSEADKRSRSSEAVVADLRGISEKLPGTNAVTWESMQGGPAGRSIEIKLSGDDFEECLVATRKLREKLASFNGVHDIDDNLDRGQREVRLRLRESARASGITVASLGNEVRGAFFGRESKRITRNREDVKIMVRYPKIDRRDVYSLESMWIPTPGEAGHRGWVPLHEVAELTEDQAFNTIQRSQQQRAVTVYADVDEEVGNDTEILASVQTWFESDLRNEHPGVRFELLGKTKEVNKALDSIKIAFPVAMLIIYMLLAGLFRSYLQPLVVMIAIPFGVQGAILGHWFLGYELTIMSYIGFVALMGIVDNDSLVLVDFINNRVRHGLSHFEASVEGSKLRLRAIVLNTITAVVGMSPLMLETSFQARFLIPMAITLTFGLIFSTVLTLVIVPAINMVFYDVQRLSHLLWTGNDEEVAEPVLLADRSE